MNTLKLIYADLIEKKLWPVVLLLVALMVGVPYYLSKPGDSPVTPAVAPMTEPTGEGPQLALTNASTTGFARPPHVNDERLDPFASRASSKAVKDAVDAVNDATDSILGGGDGSGGGPGGSGDSPTPVPEAPKPTSPADPDPEVETERDDVLAILVSEAGEAETEPTQIEDIRTLTPLVDPEDPFLVYVGKTASGAANFLVSSDVTVNGDGTCAPSLTDCRTLTLAEGETADFVYVKDPKKKLSITVLEVETKDMPILKDEAGNAGADTSDEEAELASHRFELRRAGASALKSVVGDDSIMAELARQKVVLRH